MAEKAEPILPLTVHTERETLVCRHEQICVPAVLWAVFALLSAFFAADWWAIEVAGGFLSIVLPLLGALVASTVVGEGPDREGFSAGA